MPLSVRITTTQEAGVPDLEIAVIHRDEFWSAGGSRS
jgi:hypothetical protein